MRDAQRPEPKCMPSTGELIDIERVTISSEGGRWKSTHRGNSLAAYPTSRTVLNGEVVETDRKTPRHDLTQPANPHLGRLSMSGDAPHHIIRWNVDFFRLDVVGVLLRRAR